MSAEGERRSSSGLPITERNYSRLRQQFPGAFGGEDLLLIGMGGMRVGSYYKYENRKKDNYNLRYSIDPSLDTAIEVDVCTLDPLCGIPEAERASRDKVRLFQILTKDRLPEYKTPSSVVRGQIDEGLSGKRDPVLKGLGLDIYFVWLGSKSEYRVYLWKYEDPDDVIGLTMEPTPSYEGNGTIYTFQAYDKKEEDREILKRFEEMTGYEISDISIHAYDAGPETIDSQDILGDIKISLK
jgi:hypothetical protein